MFKKFLSISFLLILNNCTSPATVLLGPALTGAKTGSVYQASLSFGTGKVLSEISNLNKNALLEKEISKNFDSVKMPNILVTHAIKEIKVSEILEPEPLP